MTRLAPTLEAFFTTRLTGQLGASAHTIAAYRDTWRLLLGYVADTTGTAAHAIDLAQLDADLISRFLTHLQDDRGNSNHHPQRTAGRSALPVRLRRRAAPRTRRVDRPGDGHPRETAPTPHRHHLPDRARGHRAAARPRPGHPGRAGRRDHALIQVAVTTGLRVSELSGLRGRDVHLGTGAHVLPTARDARTASPRWTNRV